MFGKGIGSQCSMCGKDGKREDGIFCCLACGYEAEVKVNTARNVKKRGMEAENLC